MPLVFEHFRTIPEYLAFLACNTNVFLWAVLIHWTSANNRWGYTALFRQTLFRQTLFRQSTLGRRVADCSWIGLRAVPIGKMQNHIPKIRGSTIVFEVHCNFFGGGGTPDATGIPSPGPTHLGHLGALINAMHSMCATPRPPPNFPLFLLFLHMPKHAIGVLGCPDCGAVVIASVGRESVGIVSASQLVAFRRTPGKNCCTVPSLVL